MSDRHHSHHSHHHHSSHSHHRDRHNHRSDDRRDEGRPYAAAAPGPATANRRAQRAAYERHVPKFMPSRSELNLADPPPECMGSILKQPVTPLESITSSKRTYVLSGTVGMDHRALQELLAGAGFVEVPVTVDRATFVWAELVQQFNFDKRTFRIRCVLKNMLDDGKHEITDKGRLHANMRARFPETTRKHMASTVLLRDLATTRRADGTQGVFIVRPVGRFACAGNGIVRVANDEQLARVKEDMLRPDMCPDAIASEYVTNPVLWEGRKTHLRMYWLVCAAAPGDEERRPFRHVLWRTGKIMTAELPYTNSAWDDKRVHDTHVKSTPRNLFFPDDLTSVSADDKELLYQRMSAVLADVAEVLRPSCRPYSESKLAYEVFGCDFLVTTDLNVVLLEINQRIGFFCIPTDPDPTRYADFTRRYYEFVFNNAIMPLLGPELEPLEEKPQQNEKQQEEQQEKHEEQKEPEQPSTESH